MDGHGWMDGWMDGWMHAYLNVLQNPEILFEDVCHSAVCVKGAIPHKISDPRNIDSITSIADIIAATDANHAARQTIFLYYYLTV